MKILIFNGAIDSGPYSTSKKLMRYLMEQLDKQGVDYNTFDISQNDIPFLKLPLTNLPESVQKMSQMMTEADAHIWLSPLYHGGIPGIMKNCIDWLEITANNPKPYLTDKIIGLICWAEGIQAMQGINAMDSIVSSLRAWSLPYSLPVVRRELSNEFDSDSISPFYQNKIDLMIQLLTAKVITTQG